MDRTALLSVPVFSFLTVHHVTLLKLFVPREVTRVDAEVRPDIVIQVPGLVFIMHHKEQSKLFFHIIPLSIGTVAALQSTLPAYYQSPKKTTVQILYINRRTCNKLILYCESCAFM